MTRPSRTLVKFVSFISAVQRQALIATPIRCRFIAPLLATGARTIVNTDESWVTLIIDTTFLVPGAWSGDVPHAIGQIIREFANPDADVLVSRSKTSAHSPLGRARKAIVDRYSCGSWGAGDIIPSSGRHGDGWGGQYCGLRRDFGPAATCRGELIRV